MSEELGEQATEKGAADTICALSSGHGRAGIAIIRISGPASVEALSTLAGVLPPPRHAALRSLKDPRSGTLLDRGIVLWLPGPHSFTGEDMAELHVHGGRAVIGGVIESLLALGGMRLAEPGEFARRGFENGKLDLTEMEGLADLINAETEAQRGQALAQAQGGSRRLYEAWRAELVKAQALTEAGLDFADETDVAADVAVHADAIAAKLIGAIGEQLSARSGERLREGFRVVIAGPPNAGKSSLLNALAKRDVAIVSEEAGTTRDAIEVHLDLGGLPVIVTDTAGFREAAGAVESEGIRRALAKAASADLVLWLNDATVPPTEPPAELTKGAAELVPVQSKSDLATGAEARLSVSAKTGEGLPSLIAHLEVRAREGLSGGEPAIVTRARHRAELQAAAEALQRCRCETGGPELKAEDLRLAARHLGRLTGRIDVEEVLGAIFSEFCIGK
jgi:tRNA modification GTPase